MEKCYNITVTGKVQDIGFRSVIEYVGRLLKLNGLVFNSLNAKFDSFIIVQGEHNKRLEKILEKLAER